MFSFRVKFLLSFFACMCIPLAIALIGRDFYESRADLIDRSQKIEQTYQALLDLYQKDAILLNFEQINPVFFELGITRQTEIHRRAVRDLNRDMAILYTNFADDVATQSSLRSIGEKVDEYEAHFQALLKQMRQRGFQDYGQVGDMRNLAYKIEELVNNSPELLVHTLMLRRHEKDYIIRHQDKYIEKLEQRADQFIFEAHQSQTLTPAEKTQLTSLIGQYTEQFLEVVAMDEAIGLKRSSGVYLKISAIRSQIFAQYGNLMNDLGVQFQTMNQRLNQQLSISITLLVIIALILCIYLSRALTRPLVKLTHRIRNFKDGDFREPVALHKLTNINDEVGNLARNFSALQDHIIDAFEKIKQERTSAEEANKVKSLFLANMSHELRTPLNGVIGMAQLLNTTDLNDEQKSFTDTIQHASNGLLSIVTDILDFSKIEAGKVELDAVDFDIEASIRHTVKPFELEAREKGISIHLHQPLLKNTRVLGDVDRFCQIARNLISNAVKFTTEGTIDVTLKTKQSDNKVIVCLEVSDTGIGIAPEFLSHIFDAFRQADNSTTRQFGGTGLGLSISNELAQLMGGELSVTSEPGQGSTFTARVMMQPARQVDEKSSVQNDQLDLNVLVAEDNHLNQKIIDRMLNKLGARSTIVENGAEALDILKRESFDLILMDIQMPVMDGLTAIGKIRENEQDKHQIVYALTANATSEDRSQALNAGMDGFITKPISMKTLHTTLRELPL